MAQRGDGGFIDRIDALEAGDGVERAIHAENGVDPAVERHRGEAGVAAMQARSRREQPESERKVLRLERMQFAGAGDPLRAMGGGIALSRLAVALMSELQDELDARLAPQLPTLSHGQDPPTWLAMGTRTSERVNEDVGVVEEAPHAGPSLGRPPMASSISFFETSQSGSCSAGIGSWRSSRMAALRRP